MSTAYNADHQTPRIETRIIPSIPLPERVDPLHSSCRKLLHPDLLHHILVYLPLASLAPASRVSRLFSDSVGPVLYRSISYYPDRKGHTALEGLDDIAGDDSAHCSRKQDLMRYVRHLHLGYHHHEHPHAPTPTSDHLPHRSTPLSLSANLRTLHVAGERYCTRRSCPFLADARPKTVVVKKIDLFSGSPRWINPFRLPCAETTTRAVYLVQSPFFLKANKWQGLSLESQQAETSVFIFALREYEVEWRDTARRMSDRDAHAALVEHLASICLMARRRTEIVGLELVAPHLRPSEWLSSAYPEDVVASFEEVVHRRVKARWTEAGCPGDVEDLLDRCCFVSMREYAAKGCREEEVDKALLERWAGCWEQNVACSGIAHIRG